MATSRRSDIIDTLVTQLKEIDGAESSFDSSYTYNTNLFNNVEQYEVELEIDNYMIEPIEFEERMEKDLVKMHNDLRQKEADLLRKEEDMKNKFINEIQEKEKKVFELEEKKNKMQTKIEEYIQRFQNAQGREPLEDEIIEHFQDEEQTLLNLVMTERIFNRV